MMRDVLKIKRKVVITREWINVEKRLESENWIYRLKNKRLK